MSAAKSVKSAGRPKVYVGVQAKAMALLAYTYGLSCAILVLVAKNGTKYASLRTAAIPGPIPNISKPTLAKLRDEYHTEGDHTGRGRPSADALAMFEEAAQKAFDRLKKAKSKNPTVKKAKTDTVVADTPVAPPVSEAA